MKIYIGTGGYSDTDLMGTLYPLQTPKSEFLEFYAQTYNCVEINSTFHTPIGQKALLGMVKKANGRLKFSLKIHQNFSHLRTATKQDAQHFLEALAPLIESDVLAHLLLQFPFSFIRNIENRHYLAQLCSWFSNYPLAMEFRHPSWHIEPVLNYFSNQNNLIWVNADYPQNIGLPNSPLIIQNRNAYFRFHGRNSFWWQAKTAQARHDYRYSEMELKEFADFIFNHQSELDSVYFYFQNTTKSHSFYNIQTLKALLSCV